METVVIARNMDVWPVVSSFAGGGLGDLILAPVLPKSYCNTHRFGEIQS